MNTFKSLAIRSTLLAGAAVFSAHAAAQAVDVKAQVLADYPGADIEVFETIEHSGQPATKVVFEHRDEGYEAIFDAEGQLISMQNVEFDDSTLIVGLALGVESSIYVDQDSENEIQPFIFYQNGNFSWIGESGNYTFYRGWADVSAYVELDFGGGYEVSDSPFLEGMEDTDMPIRVGLQIEKEFQAFELGFVLARDLAGSDGMKAQFEISKEFELNDWLSLETGAQITYHDSNHYDYFYGVEAKYATAERPEYSLGSGFDYGLEAMLHADFGNSWHGLLLMEYTKLASDVGDSPIVDSDNEFEVMIGVAYEF